MKKPPNGHQEIETLALKKATVVDADKVRYRVYRTPDDFVAVIAESALMAMRAAEVDHPYRIVRDLPNDGISIEAQRLQKTEQAITITRPAEKKPLKKKITVEMAEASESKDSAFVPMHVGDFKKKTVEWARVLTPDMVEAIAAARAQPKPEPVPEPMPDAQPAEAAMPVEPEPPAAVEAPTESAEPDTLSEDDVEQLLKG